MSEPVFARLAATVLMVRDGASGLEVFMVKRHRQIEFASGALVFPGGAVDPADRRHRRGRVRRPRARDARRGDARDFSRNRRAACPRPRRGGLAGGRAGGRPSHANTKAARSLRPSRRNSSTLAPEALTLFAHWITPRPLPKRFDTHFYIVAAPAGQIARHDGSGSVDSVLISPFRALAEAEKGVFTIVPATGLNLKLLGQSTDVASALAAARRVKRVVTVEPVAERTATGFFHLRIPLEAGYGVDEFTI